MAGKYKKGKNSREVDVWLDKMGYYRKNVAYDETCLFRAVSEQVYSTQIYHEKVRKECIEYGRTHPWCFDHVFPSRKALEKRLDELAVHMVICGNIELMLISQRYRREIVIFDGTKLEVHYLNNNNYSELVRLCLVNKDHFDVVYPKDYIATAGFCQSIIYTILYEKVYHINNVNEIVNAMLYEKHSLPEGELIGREFVKCTEENEFGTNKHQQEIAIFPYRVAKALDPDTYRNIEYDSWSEVRRELRFQEWYHGDDRLTLGTRCELKAEDDNCYHCYIQEFLRDGDECIVYIPDLAERRTVKYKDLSPESDAKPWPLPYRLLRNKCRIPSSLLTALQRGNMSNHKQNEIKSPKEDNSLTTNDSQYQNLEPDVGDFAGCPLQTEQGEEPVNVQKDEQQTEEVSAEPPPETLVYSDYSVVAYLDTNVSSLYVYYATSPYQEGVCSPTEYMYPTSPHPQGVYSPTEYLSSVPDQWQQQPVLMVPSIPLCPAVSPPVLPGMQYVMTPPHVYPTTPSGWYPPGVESQGFIFPTTFTGPY